MDVETYALAKAYTDSHGGGGGGTTNYEDLGNLPLINGIQLLGNKSSKDLGLASIVDEATEGNFAALDTNGNLTDSGVAAGNTSIAGIGDGTLTGAVSAEKGAIDAIVNVYGGKNLLDFYSYLKSANPASGYTKSGNSYTVNALQELGNTVYQFSDKNINGILGVTLSSTGTASRPAFFFYDSQDNQVGLEICGSITSTPVHYDLAFSGACKIKITYYELDPSHYDITFTDIMIRDSRISDSTYVPYAMTNRELTERVIFSGFGIEKTADSNGNFVLEYPVGSDYKSIYIIGVFIVSDGALRFINNANWWYIMYTSGCIFAGLTPNSTYYVKYIAEKVN